MEIKGAKVLITGGSAGIGLESAKLLASRGAKVVICGRDKARLDAAAKEAGCHGIQADMSKEEDCVRVVAESIAHLGGLDALVNNAGMGAGAPLVSMTSEILESVYRTNLFGPMLVAREAAKHFVEQNSGNILNVGSTAGDNGFPMGTAYCSSKAALKSMTECWRTELRGNNIRVTLIKPSEVVTEFAKSAGFPQEDSPQKLHGIDIAYAVLHALEQPDVGFNPEIAVWATNPPK